jgi:thiamine biosynthesis lipoprotein
VTLIGDSAMKLDALSTAVFVLGGEEGLKLIQQAGIEAVFVTVDLEVFCTGGLRENFQLLS